MIYCFWSRLSESNLSKLCRQRQEEEVREREVGRVKRERGEKEVDKRENKRARADSFVY